MGVKINREKNTWSCICGSCGWHLGPYTSEEELRKKMTNWGYSFIDGIGDSRCPECIQIAFDDQQELRKYREVRRQMSG